jgi:hypothetical protein
MTPIDLRDASYQIDHFLGVGGKYVRSTIVSQTGSAFAADMGYLVHSPEAGWSFGASGLNIGGKIKYRRRRPCPRRSRGLRRQGGVLSVHNVIASVDGDYLLDDAMAREHGPRVFLSRPWRAPRLPDPPRRWPDHGFGLRWKGPLPLDYAWGLGKSLSDQHRITVSYRFAGVPPSQRGRQRRPFIESIPERDQLRGIEDKQPQFTDPPPRPRAVPRERSTGVPGWIY